ncbi:uncharacterized protein B0T15DRAFT_540376 [Chaetomium strumarium]|uniref:Uncharacterized protein n=1 Tax=Chaetomium strumarium TaxID=1170767 RepID=A0AAJ0GP13_9PEZI|nr:hypothetical protein B0T15DRAFT_540376 [Chaetomium strumarium]
MAFRTGSQSFFLQARTLRSTASRSSGPSPYLFQRYHSARPFSTGKDNLQDRESLNPRRSEGTNFGVDDQVAEKSTAFNGNNTNPEAEKKSMDNESNGNPLDASGANQDFSKPHNPEEKTADKGDKKTRSKGHGGKKHGKVGTDVSG